MKGKLIKRKFNDMEKEMEMLMYELHELKHGEGGTLPKSLLKFTGFIEIYNPYKWQFKEKD